MNFIFISPNFPTNYWQFCHELKKDGATVLGIGDAPYNELTSELKASLDEYYRVDSLETYDDVYRAVAFYTFKYGRIDWIESNNEYWLERDAMLRTDFNINTGFKTEDMHRIKFKSGMKEYYQKAGIPVARYHMVEELEQARAFIKTVGYPVIVKPDNGVGANATYKLSNDEELMQFFENIPPTQYIMEEFIDGQICSYDAIIDSKGEPLFESGNVTMVSIMDTVNNEEDSYYYIVKKLKDDIREAGRKCVESFGVRSRFVHLEFFRLLKDQEGIGKKGDLAALEVNMRPSGGFTTDMLNYANSVDVYKIWADMIVHDRMTEKYEQEHFYCPFVGRRDERSYAHSHEDIMEKYHLAVCMSVRMPEALSAAMGNQVYIARFKTKEAMDGFFRYLLETGE